MAIDGGRRVVVIGALAVVVVAGVTLAVVRLTGDEARETTTAAYAPEIDPAEFTTVIDNPYLPLLPGTRWVYEGAGDDGESERIVVEVTDETREVMGVTVVVVRDTEFVADEVVEDTDDWFAQDAEGNVWYFGEETAEYENGEVVSTSGSWEAGVDGAQPGIVMRADPRVGDRYRQEYAAGEAEDMGEVIALDQTRSVPFGDFDGVLVTRDWTSLEPDVVENKFYAPGIGMIAEETVEGGPSRAELVELSRAD